MNGTIYLLHFDRPLHHARHYIGWSQRLSERLQHHAAGTGSRLMAAVSRLEIGWRVVRTWKGDRHLERRLKNFHGPRLCPVCVSSFAREFTGSLRRSLLGKGGGHHGPVVRCIQDQSGGHDG